MSPGNAVALKPVATMAVDRRVLIVDDSTVARVAMTQIVNATPGFRVVAAVPDALAAVAQLQRDDIEIIILDVNMPRIDGLTALPDLVALGRGAQVLVVSSTCGPDGNGGARAIAIGAAATLAKPTAASLNARFAEALRAKLAEIVAQRRPAPAPAAPQRPAEPSALRKTAYDVVAIGASTGGIHALRQFLRALPRDFALPILITQHLPRSFSGYFAGQVALLAGRPCDIAADHMRVSPGRIIIAPGDAHMRVVPISGGAAIRLSAGSVASGCMPSVDPMFETVAQVYGPRAVGIVLSGMGRDGAVGAGRIAEAGGTIVVQDEASSVVWGMPGAVHRAGLADAVLSPDAIGALISSGRRPA